jgi:hypothetical protein
MSEKKKIYAVHDIELKELLENLELLNDFEDGKITCFICNKIVTEENLGSIFPYQNDIKVSCNDIDCYNRVLKLRGESN